MNVPILPLVFREGPMIHRTLGVLGLLLAATQTAFGIEWRNDPVPPLTGDEAAFIEDGLDDKEVETLLAAFVDRAEKAYTGRARMPEGFLEWLAGQPALRTAFWLALVPGADDPIAAVRVLDTLRREDAEAVETYFHLAVAISVVWDAPRNVMMSQRICIFGVGPDQFSKPPGYLWTFRYFTEKKRQRSFLFKIEDLVWPIAVYIANFDVSEEESEWALRRMGRYRNSVGSTYAMVEYDHGKRNGQSTKLGSRPYTLANLLEYGGVCGDQAHFCSRVAKCLGIPAMKASGLSRYGGAGHAFVCYFVWKKRRPILESTGRYFNDFYYTGNVFDPQIGTRILDRTVAMMLDGASLSYEKYIQARTLARIATHVYAQRPEVSLNLAKKAVTTNHFCGTGWRVLMRHVNEGHVPPEEGLEWGNKMIRYLEDHPDLTHECFETFLGCIPREDVKQRQKFYERVADVYEERPDLQLLLREAQGKELIEAGKEKDALRVLLKACAEHGKEGRLIMPLITPAVEILDREKKYVIAFSRPLDKMIMRFPKRRMNRISASFQDLARMIIPLYEAVGKQRDADKLRRRAGL